MATVFFSLDTSGINETRGNEYWGADISGFGQNLNLTRPVSLVSTSPRNRINRDPLRTVFSLFLPSFLSFFLSRGSLKKYPRIISFRTVFASHARLALPFKRTIFGRKGTG